MEAQLSEVLLVTISIIVLLFAVKVDGKVFPHEQFASVGDTTYFKCLSVRYANWTFENGPLPQNVEKEKFTGYHTLTIKDVNMSNAGTYTCVGVTSFLWKYSYYTFESDGLLTIVGRLINILFR